MEISYDKMLAEAYSAKMAAEQVRVDLTRAIYRWFANVENPAMPLVVCKWLTYEKSEFDEKELNKFIKGFKKPSPKKQFNIDYDAINIDSISFYGGHSVSSDTICQNYDKFHNGEWSVMQYGDYAVLVYDSASNEQILDFNRLFEGFKAKLNEANHLAYFCKLTELSEMSMLILTNKSIAEKYYLTVEIGRNSLIVTEKNVALVKQRPKFSAINIFCGVSFLCYSLYQIIKIVW